MDKDEEISRLKNEVKELRSFARAIMIHFERSGIVGPLWMRARSLLKITA